VTLPRSGFTQVRWEGGHAGPGGPGVEPIGRLVEDYLAACRAKGLSPKTVKLAYRYPLRGVFLPWCAEEGITEPRQLTTRLLERPQRLVEILSRDEVQRIEDNAETERDKLIVRLLADTGIRVGELVKLRERDVIERDRNMFLRIQGKGARERLVPVAPVLARRVRRYADRVRPADASTDRLFVTRRRSASGDYLAITESGIQQMVGDLGEVAGIRRWVHPHLFRHSAATYMLQRGMNPLLVAQVLGHSSLAMIQRVYSHLTPTDAHQALMNVLKPE
jgi:integrase